MSERERKVLVIPGGRTAETDLMRLLLPLLVPFRCGAELATEHVPVVPCTLGVAHAAAQEGGRRPAALGKTVDGAVRAIAAQSPAPERGLVADHRPANGAIAHTADLAGSQINGVDIREDHTLVRLPANLSLQMLSKLRRVRVRGKVLDISRLEDGERD